MTLRKPFLTLFACALAVVAFGAFGVGNAVASTTHECKIPEEGEEFTSGHFLDPNCEKPSGAEGEYHTTFVKKNAVLKRTNTKSILIHWVPFGIEVEVKCETLGGTKTVSNIVKEGKPAFEGEGKISFSACSVIKPAGKGCTVKPFETVQLSESSEDLAGEIQRTLFVPKEGSKLATITVEGCVVEGSYAIEGKLRSQTVDIHTEEFGEKTGSELKTKGGVIFITTTFHDATASNGRTIVRELP